MEGRGTGLQDKVLWVKWGNLPSLLSRRVSYDCSSEWLPVIGILKTFPDMQAIIRSLHKCVMSRLMAQDLDQEVKDCAISCMAAVVSQLGDVLKPQLPQILQVWVSLQAHILKT